MGALGGVLLFVAFVWSMYLTGSIKVEKPKNSWEDQVASTNGSLKELQIQLKTLTQQEKLPKDQIESMTKLIREMGQLMSAQALKVVALNDTIGSISMQIKAFQLTLNAIAEKQGVKSVSQGDALNLALTALNS